MDNNIVPPQMPSPGSVDIDTNKENTNKNNKNNIIKHDQGTNNKNNINNINNSTDNNTQQITANNNSHIIMKNSNNIDTQIQLQTPQTQNTADNNHHHNAAPLLFRLSSTSPSLPLSNQRNKKRKKNKKRCAALDYLSDSPKKKRGRKVKDKKNLPPIQKQPFFLVFPDLRLKCPQCDHIAICQGTLVQHLRTHPESRKCPQCSKIFSTQQNLIKHARLHTGERPYPCPIGRCKWAYKQKGDLLAHIQRGKHGTSSDNNRKPPPFKFYHGSTKLPTLHAISKQDVFAAPDLKQLIVALRKREEMKKKQKEKVKQKRKNQLDDFVLSMFLSIYDIDNHEMKNLLKIARTKYQEKMLKKQVNIKNLNAASVSSSSDSEEIIFADNKQEQYLKIDTLPIGKKVNIKFKYLVNRVYGDYSIVLVPVHSVPRDEIYEQTPEIVIDPKLIPALQNEMYFKFEAAENVNNAVLNEQIECDIPPPVKKQKLNNGQSNCNIKELSENHIVLGKGGRGVLGRAIGHMPRKRQYHKYNQTYEGFWQCDAPNCGSLYLSKELLEKHCKELHDSGYYGCKYCERIYRSQKNVQNHLKKAHEKHGDEYLNALIYNKFNQIIKIKECVWQSIRGRSLSSASNPDLKTPQNATSLLLPDISTEKEGKLLTKSIIFKTHPFDNTILRQEHDSEQEERDSDNNKKKKLVPWTMQDKNKKSGRGRGRPRRIVNIVGSNEGKNIVKKEGAAPTPKRAGRPRGRPKGSKNKKPSLRKPASTGQTAKRRPGRPKGSTNKKIKAAKQAKQAKQITKKRGRGRPRKRCIKEEISESESEFSTNSDEDEGMSSSEEAYTETEEEDLEEDELSLSEYEIGTIYDDLHVEEESASDSSAKDEKSFLAQDIKLDKFIKQHYAKQSKKKVKRGRKRKRDEISSENNESDMDDEDNDSDDESDFIMCDNTAFGQKGENKNSNIKVKIEGIRIKPEQKSNSDDLLRLPTFDVPSIRNLGLGFNDIDLPSIANLFGNDVNNTFNNTLNSLGLNNALDIPMPAMPSLNTTTAELNGLLTHLQNSQTSNISNSHNSNGNRGRNRNNANGNGNIHMDNTVDYNSIIESLLSGGSSSHSQRQSAPSDAQSFIQSAAALSPINSMTGNMNQMNTMNAMNTMPINQLNAMSNQLNIIQNNMNHQRQRTVSYNSNNPSIHSSEEPIHPISKNNQNNNKRNFLPHNGAMLNGNKYLLKKMQNSMVNNKESVDEAQNKDKEDSESPFVPPLVEAVCGANGCVKTKRDGGKPLLMCGRCFNIKYCSKRCQLAHIHDHRQICKKKGSTKQ